MERMRAAPICLHDGQLNAALNDAHADGGGG